MKNVPQHNQGNYYVLEEPYLISGT